jgi:RNA polymerase sigma-70 factor (ECF subfamily)
MIDIMTTLEFSTQLMSFKDSLYYFSSRFYKNVQDREDLVQETLAKAFNYKDKFNAGTNFKAWIFTIMKNTFINEYKKNQKMKENSTTDDVYQYEKNFVDYNSPIDVINKMEFELKIESLDKKFSTPLKMYHEGYKYEEIAEQENLPLGTIKNRIHAARQLLISAYR